MRPAAFLCLLCAAAAPLLARYVDKCPQSATQKASCFNCTQGYGGYAGTWTTNCDDDCRANEEDCEDCCLECEGSYTGGTDITKLGVYDMHQADDKDEDTASPWAVQITVTLGCPRVGGQTNEKCVKFEITAGGALSTRCYELKCEPCL